MKFNRKSRQSSGGNHLVNVPVQVSGFTQNDSGAVGVVGTDLRNGKEVTVFLTTEGKEAENPNRKSLQALKEGFAIGRNRFTLEAGGLVAFKSVQSRSGDQLVAPWADVLAFNASDRDQYVGQSQSAMLRVFNNNESGAVRGALYVFENDPELHIKTDISEAVAAYAASTTKAAFLVRAVDAEGVVDYDMTAKRYNRDANRPMEPAEIGAYVEGLAGQIQDEHPEASINIVPVTILDVSPKWLAGEAGVRAVSAISNSYVNEGPDGHVEQVAKTTYFKLGGENNQFVNSIIPTDPYGPGHDPALLGGLKFSSRFEVENEAGQSTDAAANSTADSGAELEEAASADYGPSM